MRILSWLSAIALLLSQPAFAEPNIYFSSQGKIISHGKTLKMGFWVPALQDAEDVFKSNPLALSEYQAHVSDARWFGILNWGAVGAMLTYTIVSLGNHNYSSGTALTVFVIPWLGGIYFAGKSGGHLTKAMNIINGVAPDQARRDLRSEGFQAPILAWSF